MSPFQSAYGYQPSLFSNQMFKAFVPSAPTLVKHFQPTWRRASEVLLKSYHELLNSSDPFPTPRYLSYCSSRPSKTPLDPAYPPQFLCPASNLFRPAPWPLTLLLSSTVVMRRPQRWGYCQLANLHTTFNYYFSPAFACCFSLWIYYFFVSSWLTALFSGIPMLYYFLFCWLHWLPFVFCELMFISLGYLPCFLEILCWIVFLFVFIITLTVPSPFWGPCILSLHQYVSDLPSLKTLLFWVDCVLHFCATTPSRINPTSE